MIHILFLMLFGSNAFAAVTDIQGEVARIGHAITKIDMQCTQLKQYGPCMVGDVPGIRISYYEPTFIMSTIASKSSLGALNGGNLRFNEVHVYDFPLKQIQQAVLCSSLLSTTMGIRYLSEFNQEHWRRATVNNASYFIGNWGPLYPRTGFINHYSPGVSSALISLRGISAAGFVVDPVRDKVQMLEPNKLMCMAPGTDARLWENDHVDPAGKYLWVYWRFRECCKTAIPDPTSL